MANNTEQIRVKFTNSAPDDKEWTAHINLLNNWTTPDRYLRDIIQYARSGKHYPADMHVDLILQWHEAEATRRSELAYKEGWSAGWAQRSKDEDYSAVIGKLRAMKPQDGAFFVIGEIERAIVELKRQAAKGEQS